MKFFCNHGYHLSSHVSNGVCGKINSALSDLKLALNSCLLTVAWAKLL